MNNNGIQSLLERSNDYNSVKRKAERLSLKWEKTGLLEGLSGIERNNMTMLLENQAKQLLKETSLTGAGVAGASFTTGQGEQWAGIALPLVRKVFSTLAAKEWVSVQPMNMPSGLVFYLDFKYGTSKNPFTADESLYGITSGSGDPTGGLYGGGRYSYSNNNTASIVAATTGAATWATFDFDQDYSASFGTYKTVSVSLPTTADFEGIRAFTVTSGSDLTVALNNPNFTKNSGSVGVTFVVTGSAVTFAQGGNVTVTYQLQPTMQLRGDFEDGNTTLNSNNDPITIPEINVKLNSTEITAKTRKLKSTWTPEFAQDLQAYQALDAEAELTNIMSEYMTIEIDLEVLSMLLTNAASTDVWSAQNNVGMDTTGIIDADLGFYNSQMQWFQTLGTKLNKMANTIHKKTMRGAANFIVISPDVATIFESMTGFTSDNTDANKMTYNVGTMKAGTLSGGKFKVFKNIYMTKNTILVGYRGSQFLETGAVLAPYVPMIMTPLVYDPDTFSPSRGVMRRDAKKMIRPEFYGLIHVSGLSFL